MNDLTLQRRFLAVAGTVYFLWWFAVKLLLPEAFNPFFSRSVVVGIVFSLLILTYVNNWFKFRARLLFISSVWLITLHYFYLFYGNLGTNDWIVGSYITVIAVTCCLESSRALLLYSSFVLILASGVTFFASKSGSPVFLPGLVTVLLQANLGLRSRLETTKNLAISHERFHLLFHSTFEGILVHSGGQILNVNESLNQLFGFSPGELIGTNVLDIFQPEQRDLILERMKMEKILPYETKGRTKAGTAIDVEVRGKSFRYGKKIARLVTIQDIRDRKLAEKEKIAALTLVENIRIRDEFISVASHELKTPVTSLKLQAQLMQRELERSQLSLTRMEQAILLFNRQTDRLSELIETMLDVSRIATGNLSINRQNTDLSLLIQKAVASLQIQSFHLGSPLEYEVPKHVWVWIDQGRIQQAIENLLTNAMKYGEKKPIKIRIREDEFYISVTVEDQGLGIAPEYIHKIFDRYERAISAQNISGLGLGLYITKEIVEAHSGQIEVKSYLGKGSIFTIHLPRLAPSRLEAVEKRKSLGAFP